MGHLQSDGGGHDHSLGPPGEDQDESEVVSAADGDQAVLGRTSVLGMQLVQHLHTQSHLHPKCTCHMTAREEQEWTLQFRQKIAIG